VDKGVKQGMKRGMPLQWIGIKQGLKIGHDFYSGQGVEKGMKQGMI